MKIHDEIDDWSAGALCGALTPDEQQQFERHLADCPQCRSLHEEDRKMNDTLKEAMAGVRPDPNFERRLIEGVRGRIARPWWNPWIELHPWRGLVWLMRFRVAQGAMALILLAGLVAAMIAGGALISGDRPPRAMAQNAQVFPDMKTGARAKQADDAVEMEIRAASTGSNTTNNPGSLQVDSGAATNILFNESGATADALTGSGTVNRIGYTAKVLSGNATWSGAQGSNSWATSTNWGDTTAGSLNGQGAPGVSGTASIGDTATFIDYSSRAGTARPGTNPTLAGLTFNSAAGTNYNIAAGSVLQLGNGFTNGTVNGAVTLNGGASTTSGTFAGTITNSLGGTVINNGALAVNGVISGAGGFAKAGAGTQVFAGSNSYTGTTQLMSGTLAVNNSVGLGWGGNTLITTGSASTVTVTGGKDTISQNVALGGNQAWAVNGQISGSHALEDGSYTQMTSAGTNYLTGTGVIAGNVGHAGGQVKTLENQSTGPGVVSGVKPAQVPQLPPIIDTRKLIRTATLDFEVPAFDKALQTISRVAGENQGYIFTQNSGKGSNGKLQGEVVVKVMPANLDNFLLRVRDVGEVKNETVSAQDVSKDYYDTQSRMENAEITEQRMIDILKKKTGDVADLMEVEKEIASVRGEVEQMQGQLKYYDGLVQFATVTITLAEKGDLNQNAAWLLTQQAQLSLFSKDVEQAFTDAKNDATAANAQTLESHMERDVDGREVATLHLLLPPENSDDAINKLKAIGRIQTFTTQTQRVARNNGGSDQNKVERDKVELNLVIQHDVENAVQGTNISVLTEDVEQKYTDIKGQAAASGVEVKGADFNRARNGAEVATMLLRLPMKNYPSFIEKIKLLGKVKDLAVTRRENANSTDEAPAEIVLQIFNQAASATNAETAPKITMHGAVGESQSALMWSLRMMGVTLSFLLPWFVIGGLVASFIFIRRRMMRKQS